MKAKSLNEVSGDWSPERRSRNDELYTIGWQKVLYSL